MKLGWLVLLAAAASAQTFPIAGVIVNGQAGGPMARVRIAVAPYESPSSAVSVVTGGDGRFSFAVPQGRYVLWAERAGLRQIYGIGGPGLGFGVAIITGPGQDTGHLTFHWYPPGAITGTVTDDHGEPVEDALVQLIRSSVTGGRKRTVTADWYRTDDRGVYRAAPLTAGTYYLAVTAGPWYVKKLNSQRGSSGPTAAYAPVYYADAADLSSADALTVKPGAETHADFTLRTINGVRVLVDCPGADSRSATVSLMADGPEGARGFQRTEYFYGQPITGIPPGRYIVRLSAGGENPFSMQKAIDVGASDVTVEMAYQAPPSVRGRLTFSPPAGRPKPTVYVRLVSEATGNAYARAVEADGSFVFDKVSVGRYIPTIRGAKGFQVAQVSADGASFRDGVLEIGDGAAVTLNLTANDDTGQVKGFAVDGDKKVAGALVVLAPAKESGDPTGSQAFQTDSDGSFEFTDVRAGDYVLFGTTKLDLEFANPAAVRPYLAGGKAIRVERHGTCDERIPVIAEQ